MKILKNMPRIALALALLFVLWLAIAMFGASFGVIDPLFAFGTMTIGWGVIMAGVVGVAALIGLIAAVAIKPRSGWLTALVALAVPLGFFGGLNALRSTAESVPFIYDITTNPADAPRYSAAMMQARAASGEGVNPLIEFTVPLGKQDRWEGNADFADVTAATLIAEGYPELETLVVTQSPDKVMAAVKTVMELRGFRNVTADPAAGLVEGTDVVFWYGFEDDVVARIRSVDGGTHVDFRSTSRVGTSDLGVNAQRITDLIRALQDRLADADPKNK
ncbi:DUF1499 domain-containing protein [Pontixanthobacter sp.]|uniref:DUF1499 domain-containing protein n=1 Tax=Pontixanthobacter sp. TaxID=2792078 RepID=UPI003C79BD85